MSYSSGNRLPPPMWATPHSQMGQRRPPVYPDEVHNPPTAPSTSTRSHFAEVLSERDPGSPPLSYREPSESGHRSSSGRIGEPSPSARPPSESGYHSSSSHHRHGGSSNGSDTSSHSRHSSRSKSKSKKLKKASPLRHEILTSVPEDLPASYYPGDTPGSNPRDAAISQWVDSINGDTITCVSTDRGSRYTFGGPPPRSASSAGSQVSRHRRVEAPTDDTGVDGELISPATRQALISTEQATYMPLPGTVAPPPSPQHTYYWQTVATPFGISHVEGGYTTWAPRRH